MIPLKDVIPSRTTPFVTIALIALNGLAFFYELSLPDAKLEALLMTAGVVPGDFLIPTLLTSMFLHGGWMHFIGNMLYLWIFGDNVEDQFGHGRFFVFYLLCGAGAALAHIFMNPGSLVPTIGASGAIAGVMGAYFVLYPRSRILALVPLFIFWEVLEVPAILFLGLWFVMQFFSGVGSIAAGAGVEAGGVAFWAHVAGFVAGMAGVVVFKRRTDAGVMGSDPFLRRKKRPFTSRSGLAETRASSTPRFSKSSSHARHWPFLAFSSSTGTSARSTLLERHGRIC